MKKIGVIVVLFLTCNFVKAQVWFDLGLKGGVGSGFLINKTLSNDGRLSPVPGFNYFYGGKVGVNFGEVVGITGDFTFGENRYSFLQGELNGSSASSKYSLAFKSLNIAPLLRITKESSYLELGPQFSFLRGGTVSPGAGVTGPQDAEIYINPRMTKLIFGFGGHFIGNEIISLMAGLRFSYTASDLANDTYAGTSWPFNNYTDITEANATHPFDVQVVFELNYSLGYFVKASCGRRTAFLTF